MKGKTTCPKCSYEFIMDVPDDSEMHTIACPQCNHEFAVKRSCPEGTTEACGWEEYGEPRKTILSSMRSKTNKPLIASFLLLSTGVLGIFTAAFLYSSNGHIIPQLDLINSFFSNIDTMLLAVPFIVFSGFAIAGSITTFKRRYFVFSLICAVIGIFSVGLFIGFILSLVALILIYLSRDEFENGAQGKEF